MAIDFAPFIDSYSAMRRRMSASGLGKPIPRDAFYIEIAADAQRSRRRGNSNSTGLLFSTDTERRWWLQRRPFYHVYPAIWEAAQRVEIDKLSDDFLFQDFGPVAVSCPLIPKPLLIECRSFGRSNSRRLLMMIDSCVNDDDDPLGTTLYSFTEEDRMGSILKHKADLPVAVWSGSTPAEDPYLRFHNRLKIFALIYMLGRCNDVLERNVLAADRQKYKISDRTLRKALEERASNRQNQVVWTIGQSFQEELDEAAARGESIPHVRMPHLALYRVGEGRKEQIIKFRRGSIVHRDKLEEMPTGYYGLRYDPKLSGDQP